MNGARIHGIAAFLAAGLLSCLFSGCAEKHDRLSRIAEAVDAIPRIRPDYYGLIIPPNIGPLNFIVCEKGSGYFVSIRGENGSRVDINAANGKIEIPLGQWRNLLALNVGRSLRYTVYVRNGVKWKRFKEISNRVAAEPIDRYLVFRLMPVIYNHSRDIALMQHDIETNRESVLFAFPSYDPGCVNCHTFRNNDPQTFTLQFRGERCGNGTLVAGNAGARVIDTKFGYGSWHPNKAIITFSINKVRQSFHAARAELRDHFDLSSYIVNYNVQKGICATAGPLSDSTLLTTWPAWSADGKYLFYCASAMQREGGNEFPPKNLEQTRYSLMRIGYDPVNDTWGAVDTIVASEQTGKSVSMPRCSPDGRFIVFCMHDWGPSPHLRENSDLYCMDLRTRAVARLEVNSPYAESWHSWSRNGRWLAFSSKQMGGVFTRIFICYIDSAGRAGRQFVLPYSDPAFYDALVNVCNTPEFITAQVTLKKQDALHAIGSKQRIGCDVPKGGASLYDEKAGSQLIRQE
jgi:hypothetical protein